MASITNQNLQDDNGSDNRPVLEDTFVELEKLEDLDDAEFGLPPVDQIPSLEDILAAEDNGDFEEFLEDDDAESSNEVHLLLSGGGLNNSTYDGDHSGSGPSSVGGGSTNSGQDALLRHLGLLTSNEETVSIHSRGSLSLGQTSAASSNKSLIRLHNKRKLERSKASIMRYTY